LKKESQDGFMNEGNLKKFFTLNPAVGNINRRGDGRGTSTPGRRKFACGWRGVGRGGVKEMKNPG